MTQKLLPLPVGERSPQGSGVRFWQQYGFRATVDSAMLVLALLLAAAGAWLGLNQAPLKVGLDGSGYHLGTTTLAAGDSASYNGDVAIVIRREDGQVRAAAAGRLAGQSMQGLCILVNGAGTEECIFVVDRRSFHARDRLSGDAWQRTYDDGVRVNIRLADPGHPVPVPVPVGHQ